MKNNSLILIPVILMVFLCSFWNNSENVLHQIISESSIYSSEFSGVNSFYVGNSEFSFGTDLTGLQTFPEFYSGRIQLTTLSDWGKGREENTGNTYRYQLGSVGLSILKKNGKEISINDVNNPVQKFNLKTREIESRLV